MNPLRSLWREWALLFYRRALREIDPMHDDVGLIVNRINDLEAERNGRGCFRRFA